MKIPPLFVRGCLTPRMVRGVRGWMSWLEVWDLRKLKRWKPTVKI